MKPILYLVIPCYNEEEVLPLTAPLFLSKIRDLIAAGEIDDESRVFFVNDGFLFPAIWGIKMPCSAVLWRQKSSAM